jgi:hypothetical protein
MKTINKSMHSPKCHVDPLANSTQGLIVRIPIISRKRNHFQHLVHGSPDSRRRRMGVQARSVLNDPSWSRNQQGRPAFLEFGLGATRWTTYREEVFRRFLLASQPCPTCKLRLHASIASSRSMPDKLQHSCRSS